MSICEGKMMEMKLSEFEKLPLEKKKWTLVENEFNPCLKCGGELNFKECEHGHYGWGDEDPDKLYVTDVTNWDEGGVQYYKCKKCGYETETELSIARTIESEESFIDFLDKEGKSLTSS
jgi:Zn ribbon nucleic-acid-binding protein